MAKSHGPRVNRGEVMVQVTIRKEQLTPAQAAAWRRLWDGLLAGIDSNNSGPTTIDNGIEKDQNDGRR